MTPISPVVPGLDMGETIFAKDQPPYIPLPAFRDDDGTVVTRWRLTFRERVRVLFGGSIWLSVLTFNTPLQPVKLTAECPVEFCVQCQQEQA